MFVSVCSQEVEGRARASSTAPPSSLKSKTHARPRMSDHTISFETWKRYKQHQSHFEVYSFASRHFHLAAPCLSASSPCLSAAKPRSAVPIGVGVRDSQHHGNDVIEGKVVRYPMILSTDGDARVDLANEFLLRYSQQPRLQQEADSI